VKIGEKNLCSVCGDPAIGYFANDPEKRLVCRPCMQGMQLPEAIWICRACGCTALEPCIDVGGDGCWWAAPNLCSGCVTSAQAEALRLYQEEAA
jgi:hypothetical protein